MPSAREGLRCSPISRASVGLTPATGSSSRISLGSAHQRAADLEQLLLPAGQVGGRVGDHGSEIQPPGDGDGAGDQRILAPTRRPASAAAPAACARPAGARHRAGGSRARTGAGGRERSGTCAPDPLAVT